MAIDIIPFTVGFTPFAGRCNTATELAESSDTSLNGKLFYCEDSPTKMAYRIRGGLVTTFASAKVVNNGFGSYVDDGGFFVKLDAQNRQFTDSVKGQATSWTINQTFNGYFDGSGNWTMTKADEDGWFIRSVYDKATRKTTVQKFTVETSTLTQTKIEEFVIDHAAKTLTYTVAPAGLGSTGGTGNQYFYKHKGINSTPEIGSDTVGSGSFSIASGLLTATAANSRRTVGGTIPADRYAECVAVLNPTTAALILLKDGANVVYVNLYRDATSKLQILNTAIGGSNLAVEANVTYSASTRLRVWVIDSYVYASYNGTEISYPIPSAQQSLTDVLYFQLSTSGGAFAYCAGMNY